MSDNEFIDGLECLSYVSLPSHRYLAEGYDRPGGPNIGASGENLTVMFLSMDRVSLSERLCRSIEKQIPHFKGEILAVDNGSQPEELETLQRILASLPFRTRIERLGENYGVAGGRNRGAAVVRTDWILSLDNDIYFVSDPLKHWQSEIALLGSKFFSLALLDPSLDSVFLRGGNLYVDYHDGEIHLGGGSAGKPTDARRLSGAPFLGTCLMGGASIFDVHRFRALGGFDDNMFVGFEDIEFSLRLFREGYKIGCSSLAALVHDHPKPQNAVDKAYEQVRFRRNYIKESAAYFESRHGYKVWNDGVDTWLKGRERELDIAAGDDRPLQSGDSRESGGLNRPKILLVVDVFGWAFSNIANQIKRGLSHIYDITIIAAEDVDHHGQVALIARNFDLVHVFWRASVFSMLDEPALGYADAVGYSDKQQYLDCLLGRRITTAIYDHLFLETDQVARYRELLEKFVDGYYVSSNKLMSIYRAKYPDAFPMRAIPDGVDLSLFRPMNLERFENRDRPLVIGWVGNSMWSAEKEDFKGLHSILKPALEQLRSEGLELNEVFADRAVEYTPLSQMPDYYARIDVLICASKIEGTPNPVLEAMACGVPVISTDVGIVPEAFGALQKSFMLADRSVASMTEAIRRLYQDRATLTELSRENLKAIVPWNWSNRVQEFRRFFDDVLAHPPKQKRRLSVK